MRAVSWRDAVATLRSRMHPEETRPQPSAVEAAVSLLADDDPRVAARCRQQILAWGAAALPVLERASVQGGARLRVRARALIKTLRLQEWTDTVRSFARAYGGGGATRRMRSEGEALEVGLLLLSAVGGAEAQTEAFLGQLEDVAARLRQRVQGRTAASAARALGGLLAGEVRLRTDGASFFDLETLRVDRALETSVGQPFTLCALYVLVARRAGLRVSAVSLPRDWLVRVHGARPVLVDPTRDGNSLTKADCIRHLRATGYSKAASTYLVDVDDRALLLAHVRCLQQVFGYREDGETLRALRQAADLLAPPPVDGQLF